LVGKDALFLAVVVDAVIAEIFLRLLCADLHAFVDDGSQFLFLALSVKSYL
jgi:TRAP-type C4-dicarboxylate transport system permease small subunit